MENNSVKESVNRFNQILEYVSEVDSGFMEDNNPEMPPMGDPNQGEAPMPDDGSMGDPNQEGGVEGFEPQGEEVDTGVEDEEEDEEVIDVDDLTNTQEKTEKKVDRINSKFKKLYNTIEKLEQSLDSNSKNLEDLRSELEKRNPTPVEKLSLRSKDGYPFNVSVDDYWKDKGITSDNYSAEDDNDGADDEIYKITKNDIDSDRNWKEIADTMNDDDMYMSLKDILGY